MHAAERRYLERAVAGDPEAFDALVAPRRAALLLRAMAVLGDWHEAEDALQEGLWRAFRDIRRLREMGAFDAWLCRIVQNAARDGLRSAVARGRREGAPWGDLTDLARLVSWEASAAIAPGVPDHAMAAVSGVPEPGERVRAALRTLPPHQRRAGVLAWVVGMPPREVGRVLEASPQSVHAVLGRARRRLDGLLGTRDGEGGPTTMGGVSDATGDDLRVCGWSLRVDRLVTHWRVTQPALRPVRVRTGDPDADLAVETFLEEPPVEAAGPPDAASAIPLDGLAEAVGFDLEPFGERLRPWTWGGHVYGLPWVATLNGVAYNADLLDAAGLPPPPLDWTWDDFLGYCRRCAAAGVRPVATSPFGGDIVPYVAEQLGATPSHLAPVALAVDLGRRWDAALAPLAPDTGDIWERTFYPGRAAMMTTHSGGPYWGLSEPENHPRPFRWGIAPMPRLRPTDPHRPYWVRSVLFVRGAARDPLAAFRAAAAACAAGPPPRGGELPAYRTVEAMRAWRADPLPLGKECLLTQEAQTPGWTPSLYAVPGVRGIGERMIAGDMPVTHGLRCLAQAVEAAAPGRPTS